MDISLINYIIFLLLVVCSGSSSTDKAGDENSKIDNKQSVSQEGKFEYIRKEPGNELGIFSKVIAHIHRKANEATEEWRLSREYLPDDVFKSLVSRCKTDPENSPFKWRDCKSDEEGLFAHVTWGIPEPKNKTVTYLELEFEPFSRVNELGREEICILEEVYKTKAYVVLKTFSEVSSNNSFPRGVADSVAVVHQHQLDEFGENFLNIFEDKIDISKIYSFGIDEHYDRDPPYECFLSIASSESKSVIETKCDFFCPGEATSIPAEELEKILIQAKKVAEEEERKGDNQDDDEDSLDDQLHDEL